MAKDTSKPKKTQARLTDNQEGFAITCITNNDNASDSYRKNYSTDNMKETTIWREAHAVRHNPKVSARIDELRKQRYSKKILTIDERKVILSELIIDGDTKAMDILNKMEGIYVEKKQVEHSGTIVKRTINVNPTKKK